MASVRDGDIGYESGGWLGKVSGLRNGGGLKKCYEG